MRPDAPLDIPGLVNPRVIGRGGFGAVYEVEEPEFGRSVAVKVIQERLDGDSARRAFARECQAMGSLSGHPHIVSVHRGGTTARGEPYIVMDLMSSGSLSDRLGRTGPLPWPEVLEIGVTVAGALETAHRAGILHLDLKPANLLVSRYGEPKLGDFGISRLAGVTETTDGAVRASAAYAAPERLLEGTATPASDLYGLGATLFALLTGRPAFVVDGADLLATMARVARDPVPDLRGRGVPDPVARVVEQLMAKEPAARFASAAEAAAALQAAQRVTGQPVTRAVIEGDEPTRAAGPGPGWGGASPTLVTPGATRAHPPRSHPLEGHPARSYPLPDDGPEPAAGGPGSRRPRSLVVAAVAVVAAALVVALGVVGPFDLFGASGSRTTGPDVPLIAGGPATPQPAAPAPDPTDPDPDATPAASATPVAAPTTSPVTIPPDPVIGVVDGVDHPATVDARAVLRGYVTGINESRYDDAFAYFSPESESARGGLEQWQAGQESTVIDSPEIVDVRDAGPDTVEVDLLFTSFQSEEFGPDGQTCTDWELTYTMVGPGPGWLIREARTLAEPRPC